MWTGRRVSLGLTAIAAIALVSALAGALFMPTGYCQELGTPTTEAIMIGGVVVAGIAALFAMLVAAGAGELAVMGLGLALIAPGAGVVLLAAGRYSSWSCG